MLSFIKGDKALLEAFVTKVDNLTSEAYIASTWESFATVLQTSKDVLANENAMQDEINETYDALVRAFLELRLKPNKDLLTDLIKKVEGLNAAKYTADTFAVLDSKLAEARAVLDNEDADQKAVNAAYAALNSAFEGLTVIDSENSTVPELPTNPALPSDSGTTVKTGDTSAKESAIKTGDTTSFAGVTTLGASIAVLAYLALSRKKEEN